MLAVTGERVVSALRDAEVKLTKPRRASMKLDRAALGPDCPDPYAGARRRGRAPHGPRR
ncbi:hypothetical protein [Sorangium sp. So ce1024]|uniref:hypothetical protein n=1 Tax=Sorangium sp. So ce1024 TaxID=3133327 RepID=UPI003F04B946